MVFTDPMAEVIKILCEASLIERYDIWVSSMNDRKHSVPSFHYDDLGIDFVPDVPEADFEGELDALTRYVTRRLGRDYQVINEKDHTHVEWDFK